MTNIVQNVIDERKKRLNQISADSIREDFIGHSIDSIKDLEQAKEYNDETDRQMLGMVDDSHDCKLMSDGFCSCITKQI